MGEILQDNEDFRVEMVQWKDRPAVKKQIKKTTPAHRAERLKNEVYAMGFLSDLAAKNPQARLYIPNLYEQGDSYLIREYIDADPLIQLEMTQELAAPRLDLL